jgi:hypothetical protein
MPNTDAEVEDTKKLLIFIDVVDKPDIHVGAYSTPPGLNRDGTDHITVSLNKANAAVAKALAAGDHDEIMRLVNWMLIHEMDLWPHHYPLARIREHVWKEAKPVFAGGHKVADLWPNSTRRTSLPKSIFPKAFPRSATPHTGQRQAEAKRRERGGGEFPHGSRFFFKRSKKNYRLAPHSQN